MKSYFFIRGNRYFHRIVRWPEEEFSFRHHACRLCARNKIHRSPGTEHGPIKFAKLKSDYSGLWIRNKGWRRKREAKFSSEPWDLRANNRSYVTKKTLGSLVMRISWRNGACRYNSMQLAFVIVFIPRWKILRWRFSFASYLSCQSLYAIYLCLNS